MKQLLNNVLSVVFLRPDRYRPPPRPAWTAGWWTGATVAAALLAFGGGALWIVGFAYLVGLLALPCKILASKTPPDDDALGPALARGLFASMIAVWPLGLAVAAQLPAELLAAFGLHAVLQIWLQVVLPRRPATGSVDRAFTRAGPAIGMFRGREIAAWLVDVHGTCYDFVGCAADPLELRLAEGQTVVRPGIIYQARQRG
jgi:hypothetical protein